MQKFKTTVHPLFANQSATSDQAIQTEGLKPEDQVERSDLELKKQGIHRRAFLRYAFKAGSWGATVLGVASNIYNIWEKQKATDRQLLDNLFGIGERISGALVPAGNHPFKGPPDGMPYYPIEAACCEAYKERFFPEVALRIVTKRPNIRDDDSVILFGSQVSNLTTRTIFGSPWQTRPRLSVERPGHWQTALRWNLHTPPNAGITTRTQYRTGWKTWDHIIVSAGLNEVYKSKHGATRLEDDYLLITSLPRYKRGQQRIIAFAGIHGPGTLAIAQLLNAPPMKELQKLSRKISREPYYQALFHVSLSEAPEGELVPKDIELVDAARLDIK